MKKHNLVLYWYRYDTETGLYYLQSRYYNPEWGRFINSDGVAGQTGELLSIICLHIVRIIP
ncbi:RHS repeat-associated core domain-containing protein [Clostridium manihotivorum]|uniref:RHS repeat-associated core domain-containing protein n=1 Tax=Clostridium manihotivorum TaxID=2320868 RepID=UPI0030842B11